MADVIAQVASLPVSDIRVGLIQQKLGVLFHEAFDTFTELRLMEWTKKVRGGSGTWGTRVGCSGRQGPCCTPSLCPLSSHLALATPQSLAERVVGPLGQCLACHLCCPWPVGWARVSGAPCLWGAGCLLQARWPLSYMWVRAFA